MHTPYIISTENLWHTKVYSSFLMKGFTHIAPINVVKSYTCKSPPLAQVLMVEPMQKCSLFFLSLIFFRCNIKQTSGTGRSKKKKKKNLPFPTNDWSVWLFFRVHKNFFVFLRVVESIKQKVRHFLPHPKIPLEAWLYNSLIFVEFIIKHFLAQTVSSEPFKLKFMLCFTKFLCNFHLLNMAFVLKLID